MNIMVKKYIVLLSYLKLDFCAHEVGGLNYPYRPDRREGPALYLGGWSYSFKNRQFFCRAGSIKGGWGIEQLQINSAFRAGAGTSAFFIDGIRPKDYMYAEKRPMFWKFGGIFGGTWEIAL